MASKNLWGDLSKLKTVRSPKAILQEQGDHLTGATGGMLVGNVDARGTGRAFVYDLDIKVPVLNNYIYTILTIEHGVTLYPVEVRTKESSPPRKCVDEQEFEKAIESILGSKYVQLIVARLLSQTT